MRDPDERLRDIMDAIAAIERHLGRDKAAFEQDELLQVWFLRHLQIIGEAARALPEDVRALAPDILWLKIIGMRNILGTWKSTRRSFGMQQLATCRHRSPLRSGCSKHWRDASSDRLLLQPSFLEAAGADGPPLGCSGPKESEGVGVWPVSGSATLLQT